MLDLEEVEQNIGLGVGSLTKSKPQTELRMMDKEVEPRVSMDEDTPSMSLYGTLYRILYETIM